jgi:hypothetical protein
MMPLALVVRLLPSAVVSFNLWVALPVPIAAAGTFAFLRRHASPAAAALGACIFALSGPVISVVNLPNLAWSVAFVPWVLAATDGLRITAHGPRATPLALAFALQGFCGEPVTWAATGVLAAGYAVFRLKPEAAGANSIASAGSVASAFRLRGTPRRTAVALAEAVRRKIRPIVGLALGGLLAAAQLVPTALAGVRAHRAELATPDFWSLHPLALWEALAPHLFGNYYDAFLADLPWMAALNFGREPFFHLVYVGPLVLLLAAIGGMTRLPRHAFWIAVFVVFTIAALGGYTPVYPWLRRLVPPLMYFRFPVKYLVFGVFASRCSPRKDSRNCWIAETARGCWLLLAASRSCASCSR